MQNDIEPPLRSFDQTQIEDPDQITLYTELIHILEKDIEEIRKKGERDGLSIWGILTGIVAGLGFMFSKTSQLTAIPPDTIKVATTSLIVAYLFIFIYNLLSQNQGLKPKRLMSSKEFVRDRIFFFVFRTLALGALSYFLLGTDFIPWTTTVSVVLLFVPVLLLAIYIVAMLFSERPFGNNPEAQKASYLGSALAFACYLVPAILLGSQLAFPFGEAATTAFSLGLTVSGIVVLVELLCSTVLAETSATHYLDLRDDLVLRELSLNDALERYRIIREGKSSWDELKQEFQEIMQAVDHHIAVYGEQLDIISKQDEALIDDFNRLSASFVVHAESLRTSWPPLQKRLDRFTKRLSKVYAATGDRTTDQFIRDEIQKKLLEAVDKEKQVNEQNSALLRRRGLIPRPPSD